MSFEAAPPNKFRATLLGGPEQLLAKIKKPRVDHSVEGLGAVKVSRSEARRTNQRDADRYRVEDGHATIVHKGKEHPVELINLSRGGAMVSGSLGATIWERLDLVLGEFGSVECAVQWIRGDRYGLEFAHETRIDCHADVQDQILRDVIQNCFPDVEEETFEVEQGGQAGPDREHLRKTRRHPMIWKGIVYHSYEWDVVRLRNISAGGTLIECATDLPEGMTVYLELDRIGRVAATVCWSKGGQAGLSFHEPFDLHRLSAAAPAIAPQDWNQPDYLKQDEGQASPWADRWGRLSVSELRYALRG